MVHMVQTEVMHGVNPVVITPMLHDNTKVTDNTETRTVNGVPREWFNVSENETRLDSRVAEKLKWEIQTTRQNIVNITPVTQTIRVNGVEHDVTPRVITCEVHAGDIGR